MRMRFKLLIAALLHTTLPCYAAEFVIKDAAKELVFFIKTECEAERCEGPASIEIKSRNSAHIQTLQTPETSLFLEENEELSPSVPRLYLKQGAIIVDDFNFDGALDIAIRNGNNSAYSGPSYDYYVFKRKSQRFELSAELSDLAMSNLGRLGIDHKKKHIITSEKSGCCWHLTTHYAVVPQHGLAVVYSKEEATRADGKYLDVTISKVVNGKLKSQTKTYLVSQYYK